MTFGQRATRLISVCAVTTAIASCGKVAEQAKPEAEPVPDVSVTVAPVVSTTLHAYVTGWGPVEPEPADGARPPASASVAAPVSGLIVAIDTADGARVTRGATLFRLDSRLADVAVERAQQAVRFAESVVKRQEQLGPGEGTSMRAYQDAKQQLTAAESDVAAAEAERRLLQVKAPIDGTIMRVTAKLGDAVDPTKVLAEIVDLDRLVVNAAVRSVDVPFVKRGQTIEMSPGTAPGAPAVAAGRGVSSTVSYIGPDVDRATDTVLVRARVPARAGLKPGQFVNARIAVDERRNVLAVPFESVVQGPNGPEVGLVKGDTATRTKVTLGLRDNALVEVRGEGIREGMSVVMRGAYGLPPTAKITIVGR